VQYYYQRYKTGLLQHNRVKFAGIHDDGGVEDQAFGSIGPEELIDVLHTIAQTSQDGFALERRTERAITRLRDLRAASLKANFYPHV